MLDKIIQLMREAKHSDTEELRFNITNMRQALDREIKIAKELSGFNPKEHLLDGGKPADIAKNKQMLKESKESASVYEEVIADLNKSLSKANIPWDQTISHTQRIYMACENIKQRIISLIISDVKINPAEMNSFNANIGALAKKLEDTGINFEGADIELLASIEKIEIPESISEVA